MWIPIADYKTLITDSRLQQIIGADEDVITEAEDYAKGLVSEHLSTRYDTAAAFALAPSANPVLKRWIMFIVLYQVWQRVPDKLIPERVVKNYDDTIERLKDIEDGNANTMLPPKLSPEEDGAQALTKFRWGSNTRRTH
jgi:phage gp36-like protein